jgi:prevent-host-death family protein
MKRVVIGASKVKTHWSELLDRVEEGEQFEVIRRGRAVARLMPCEVRPAADDLKKLVSRVREERGIYGISRRDLAAWKAERRR